MNYRRNSQWISTPKESKQFMDGLIILYGNNCSLHCFSDRCRFSRAGIPSGIAPVGSSLGSSRKFFKDSSSRKSGKRYCWDSSNRNRNRTNFGSWRFGVSIFFCVKNPSSEILYNTMKIIHLEVLENTSRSFSGISLIPSGIGFYEFLQKLLQELLFQFQIFLRKIFQDFIWEFLQQEFLVVFLGHWEFSQNF